MKILSLAGLVLFMVASLVIGVRLLWLGRQRRAPELLMGIALFVGGFLAFALGTTGKLFLDVSETSRFALTLVGLGLEYTGNVAMVLFAWRVFHRRRLWAMAMATVFVVGACTMLTLEIATGEVLRYSDPLPIEGPWVPLALGVRALAPTWLALECLRFHANLRKRLKLGLAKRIVVQRVLLWGVGMLCVAAGYAISVAHRLIYATGITAHPWAVMAVSTCLLVSALSLGWAFFPPESYRRRMEEDES